jgi:hypothetical protein
VSGPTGTAFVSSGKDVVVEVFVEVVVAAPEPVVGGDVESIDLVSGTPPVVETASPAEHAATTRAATQHTQDRRLTSHMTTRTASEFPAHIDIPERNRTYRPPHQIGTYRSGYGCGAESRERKI